MSMKISEYTKYEKACIVGARALQIAMGAPLLIAFDAAKLEQLAFNPVKIALEEFQQEVLPITIKRPMP